MGEAPEVADTLTPEGSAEDQSVRAEDTEHRAEDEHAERSSVEPHGTTIRVVNASAEVRSRYVPCGGQPYSLGIWPTAVDGNPKSPTCRPIDCATLEPDEILMPDTECPLLSCGDGRLDLAPGAADADYHWNGIYLTLTERNCYDQTTFELGTPMLVRICFGKPPEGNNDVRDSTCGDYPFAYGAPLLEVGLQ
jgi:hypothetical protein